jgi:arginine N-succinyltransferase
VSGREDYIVRPVRRADIDDFLQLRELAGAGFTSLMVDDETLERRLLAAEIAFASLHDRPGPERYLMALEHRATGQVVGSAAVKSSIGDSPPFFNFRILQIAQASAAAERRFDMDVLILVNEFTRCSEVGSLFVHPEHRAGGVGRMLAQARYLLMAAEPQRFAPVVVSELRGVVGEDGRSAFWEALGRHFFKMDFAQADTLSANTDNQFILDLMPKYPIYLDLLPFEARAVIGRCHPHGEGALKLLQWEGFRFDRVVDIFDGGPLVSCPRDSIRTFREAKRLTVKLGAPAQPRPALLARTALDGFRATAGVVDVDAGHVTLGAALAAAMGVEAGEDLLIWTGEASR